MKKKIIFLDIDGTLTVAGSNVIPESAVQAIKRTREIGNEVYLCTGRNKGMLQQVYEYGFDGFVASAGGYISCQNEIIFDCPMPSRDKNKILELFRKNHVFYTVETLNDTYTDDGFKHFLEENAGDNSNSELLRWRRQIEKSLNIKSVSEYTGDQVYKIIFMCQRQEQLEEAMELYKNKYMFCIQEKDQYGIINGEIINREFDKGQAVERVCRQRNFSIDESIAFGDSMNDKEMMETVGFSICMENGNESLKRLADAVCESVDQDGLAKAFETYQLV